MLLLVSVVSECICRRAFHSVVAKILDFAITRPSFEALTASQSAENIAGDIVVHLLQLPFWAAVAAGAYSGHIQRKFVKILDNCLNSSIIGEIFQKLAKSRGVKLLSHHRCGGPCAPKLTRGEGLPYALYLFPSKHARSYVMPEHLAQRGGVVPNIWAHARGSGGAHSAARFVLIVPSAAAGVKQGRQHYTLIT